jgi:uracil-DNA glycosylase family 4
VGRDRDEILPRVHMTSICKCRIEYPKFQHQAGRNCLPYLQQQIAILRPGICITLGAHVLKFLFNTEIELETAISRIWSESDLGILFPLLPVPCRICPLPHPSPRSTWLNNEAHATLLRAALERLRSELQHA